MLDHPKKNNNGGQNNNNGGINNNNGGQNNNNGDQNNNDRSEQSDNGDNDEGDNESDYPDFRTSEEVLSQINLAYGEIKKIKSLVQTPETRQRLIRLETKYDTLTEILASLARDSEKIQNTLESIPNSGLTPLYSKINFRKTLKLQEFDLGLRIQKIYDILKGTKTPLRQRIFRRIMEEIDLISNYLINIIPLGDQPKVIDPTLLRECVDLVAADKPIVSMLYHDDYLWAFNTDKHYGYKYKSMWFGGVPQWALRERTIFSSTFPPELLCDKTLIHHHSVYCLGRHIRVEDNKCIKDTVKSCDYTFTFSADAHTELIEDLTYACNTTCEIYQHEGNPIASFLMTPDIINKYFGKTGSFNDILGVIYDFIMQHWWAIFVWISFGGFNVLIVIVTCFSNYFISNEGEFRWFPCTKNDAKNLAKCCCCKEQEIRHAEYELVNIQGPAV